MSENLATVGSDEARLAVLEAIRAAPGPFTQSDIVARTGLAPHDADRVLGRVVRDYESRLDVDEDGTLVYTFEPGLIARPDVVEADRKLRRRQALRRGAKAAFKAWTMLMVIVYAIIYALLFIAFMIAVTAQSQNSDSRRRGPRIDIGRGMFWWYIFGRDGRGSRWGRRRYGREIRERVGRGEDPYDMRSTPAEKAKPSLIERTWYFLFGSEAIDRTPLEIERELVTYVRAKKGLITNADIVALLGVPYDEADRIGTRLVATYDGEMDITDAGLPIYRFPDLMVSAREEVATGAPTLNYLWQHKAREHALRSNPTFLIPFLNAFNLGLCAFTALRILPMFGWTGALPWFFLVLFPGVFSVLFFLVAGRRKWRELRDKDRYERDNLRIAVYRLLFTRRRPVVIPGDERAIAEAGLGSFSPERIRALAGPIAEELRGEALADGPRVEIRAPRPLAELDAVERLRRGASPKQSVGKTVFSSGGLADEIDALERELASQPA
ncbi:MAG: hypothetical protein H6744_07485 [Deltaproteobacteria bacterium]|nr:hypothetical protein [Deltaproteobacteria bacterium]MCB9786522.1 hypothetical protein [Deltaproteobacteria bacterium]